MIRALGAILLGLLFLAPASVSAQGGFADPDDLELLRSLQGDPNSTSLDHRNVELLGAGPVDPDAYVLGPGDDLQLEITGAFSLSTTARVGADGWVSFPQLGPLEVGGLSLTEARAKVKTEGANLVRGSSVHLALRGMRAFKAYVVGEVQEPGTVIATAMTRISEAISAVEGLTGSADLRNIRVTHPDGTEHTADLAPFLLWGSMQGNPTLIDGAVIAVIPRTRTVDVLGAVIHPGTYDYRENEGLESLLRLAGLGPEADSSSLVLQRLRPGSSRWDSVRVDLRAVLNGDSSETLRPYDRILVRYRIELPEVETVQVLGAVRQPGPIPIVRNGVRLSDAIEAAGGALEDAVLARVLVEREFAADTTGSGELVPERQYFKQITGRSRREVVVDLTRGDGPWLEPGDIVTVPRDGGFVHVSGQVRQPGFYDFVPGWDARDYVEAAGGFGKQANKGQTRVAQGSHGEAVFAADVDSLAPGDLIWVPEKNPPDFWNSVRDFAGLAVSLVTVIVLVREISQ